MKSEANFNKPYADTVAKLRVPSGFLLVASFLWLSDPTWESLGWGIPVCLAGLALRAWAAGHLRKNLQLTTSGPFAYIRNPLYVGTLTVAAGVVIAARRWELGVIFAAVFLLVYLPVVELEEQHLADLFPGFKAYKQRVPKLLPRPGRAATFIGSHEPFRWSQYMHNREYEAGIGFLVGLAVLIWKAW